MQATDDQEDVARLFERYNLLSVGVVDDAGRLVGVITIDDIVDIIEEEADEDIKRLAGVGDEEISDSVVSVGAAARFAGCSSTSSPLSWPPPSSACSTAPSSRWWRSPC